MALARGYAYDPIGNRTQHTEGSPAVTSTYVRNALNQYERVYRFGDPEGALFPAYDAAGNLIATDLLGDMNCDGAVNSDDRGPFKMAVNNPNHYALTYPDCMLELGDLNADGLVNTTDLDLFANVVSSTLLVARRYEYDEENRLTAVTEIDGNPLLEIEYDALGRRIASTEYGVAVDPCTGDAGPVTVQTRYIYSGLNAVAEYISCDGGDWGLAREVLWGRRFPEPLALFDFTAAGDEDAGTEEVLHYVHDALGSVVGLVDAGDPDATPEPVPPKLVERYDYDPYGKTYIESWDASAGGGSGAWVRTTASAYGNPFAWTGQRYDAGVGMYHFPFRSFSPELGRWMQRDPLGYVDGVNLFEYVRSMPAALTDVLGLDDAEKVSRTVASGEWDGGGAWRVDREYYEGVPADSGRARGSIHIQITENGVTRKIEYDPTTGSFLENGRPISKSLEKELRSNTKIMKGLQKAVGELDKLGAKTLKFGTGTVALSTLLLSLLTDPAFALDKMPDLPEFRELLEALSKGDLLRANQKAEELALKLAEGGFALSGLDWLEAWNHLIEPKLAAIVREQERKAREERGVDKWKIERDRAEGEAMWGKLPTVCD